MDEQPLHQYEDQHCGKAASTQFFSPYPAARPRSNLFITDFPLAKVYARGRVSRHGCGKQTMTTPKWNSQPIRHAFLLVFLPLRTQACPRFDV